MRLLKLIRLELGSLVQFVIVFYPCSPLGNSMRRLFWARRLRIREGFNIERCAIVGHRKTVQIGKNFTLGEYSEIASGPSDLGVWIGNNVAIARHVWLRTSNHSTKRLDVPIAKQGHDQKVVVFDGCEYNIVIEDDVWVAPNAVILSGTYIGQGSVIAAGAVVSGKIAPFSIVVGNPSRVVANRKKIAKMEESRGD